MIRNKPIKHPFSRIFSLKYLQETFIFGLLRGLTYFVLFCAAFLFWDIISKGNSKVFEGPGLINKEFLTEHPQTLHVIGQGPEEIKVSSSNYYKLKDTKMYEKWNIFAQSQEYSIQQRKLQFATNLLQEEWNGEELGIAREKFIQREHKQVANKFSFWKNLLIDPDSTASDFGVEIEKVPSLVSQFLLGFFEKERSRLAQMEEKIRLFRAQQYPNIENLNLENIDSIELAYKKILSEVPSIFEQKMKLFGADISSTYSKFLNSNNPKDFGRFAGAVIAYSPIRLAYLGEDRNTSNWNSLQDAMSPFKEAMSVSLPSRDFAYSGGGIFPAIVGTILLVLGAMAIAIMLGVFCAIFLAEYGKAGKFLSIIRLAILNLAGVPSIIFGLFGFGLFVIFLDWNVSLLAGWFTLAFMVLPIVITSSEEALRSIPQGFRESSLALGATKWTMIRTSVLPFAMPGILTSSILGVTRAAGETAPIMFTAAYAKRSELPWEGLEHWSDFFFQGVMALPYHIYVVSAKIPQNEYTSDMQYGTAFVFLLLVVGITSISIMIRNRLRKKYRW